MRYIIIMSLAGSLLQLFYYCTNNKKIKIFSYGQQDFLLKAVVFFYLIPPVFLAEVYRWGLNSLPIKKWMDSDGVFEYTFFYSKVESKILFNNTYKLQVAAFFIWFLIALIVFCFRIGCYIKKRKALLARVQPVTEGIAYELLEQVRIEQKIKRKIQLYHVPATAITMGIFHPVICCDCNENAECLEMVLVHECAHIRRLDVLTRQLVVLAQSIHWFNPLVYKMSKSTERVFEFCCDKSVVKNVDRNKRKIYATMLVMRSTKEITEVQGFYHALSANAKELEERIQAIMNTKTRIKLKTLLSAILLCVVFFMDSWTVLAYPDVKEIEVDSSEEFHSNADVFFVEEGVAGPYGNLDYVIMYEKQFVDEEGNIYPVQEELSTAAICLFHNWVSGQVQEHVNNSDGGCTVYIYEAKRCSKCGKVKLGDLVNEITYKTCIH